MDEPAPRPPGDHPKCPYRLALRVLAVAGVVAFVEFVVLIFWR